jgi:hypothetical protein
MKRSLLLGLAVALVPLSAQGQDTEWNRYTLEDLGGVHVRFDVTDACESAGVTASLYEADASLKLMDAEVGVLTMEEMLEHPAMPELRITIDCASGSNGSSGSAAWSVALRVQQSAQMLRDTQITLPEAVTWFSSEIGVSSQGALADAIGAALTREVEGFVEAWTEVHAEEEGGNG